MTVESNDSIPIPTLSDLLKDLAPVFQPVRSKTKPPPRTRDFSHALSKLQVIATKSD